MASGRASGTYMTPDAIHIIIVKSAEPVTQKGTAAAMMALTTPKPSPSNIMASSARTRLSDIDGHEIDPGDPENCEHDEDDEPGVEHFDNGSREENIGDLYGRKGEKRPVDDDAHHDEARYIIERHEGNDACREPERGVVAIGCDATEPRINDEEKEDM